ncbi:MAG: S-adenosyl-l-methionine hydroxide adenosyltransferase family protein [Candidatus Limnocylindrales bacterium]
MWRRVGAVRAWLATIAAMPTAHRQPLTTPAASDADPRAGRDHPVISLTTDFGARDPSAAICTGVILTIAPRATVIDISHEVAKFQVSDGALLLWCALPYLPVGVHVAVVDPGVGTARLPIGVATARGDVLVGPDNGLLLPAAERLGGISAAHVLENPDYRLATVTASFHGRDIFAPAAAHLALGVALAEFGRPLDPSTLVRLDWPEPRRSPGALETGVIYVDTFGNVKLAGELADLEAALGPLADGDRLAIAWAGAPEPGEADTASEIEAAFVETFGRVAPGQALVYVDSYGRLCLAANQASLAANLGLRAGQPLSLRRV